MNFEFGPTMQQLYALQKALQRGDTQQVALLREQTHVDYEYEELTAVVRFMQIGMAEDFLQAQYLRSQELAMQRDLQQLRAFIQNEHDARAQRADLLRHMDMEDRRRQTAEYQKEERKRQRAQEEARHAQEENDAWS